MKDKFFIDTNIFVYTFDYRAKKKNRISRNLISKALKEYNGVISFQVIQEFINAIAKKVDKEITSNDIIKYVEVVLSQLLEVFPSIDLYKSAIDIKERWQLSFYDSLIIAAALEANCNILYTEDLQHGLKVYELEVVNPFK